MEGLAVGWLPVDFPVVRVVRLLYWLMDYIVLIVLVDYMGLKDEWPLMLSLIDGRTVYRILNRDDGQANAGSAEGSIPEEWDIDGTFLYAIDK
jgi:hypothetical protein